MLTEVKPGKVIEGEVLSFTQHECGGCGIPFYVPTNWLKAKVQSKGSFSCPNGCSRVFCGKTDAEKLKEQLELQRKENEAVQQQLQDRWLDALGEKNKLEKQLKRIHKGVCPCCNRSFQNLQRHMATKHPELNKTSKQ